jgi:Uncharacterized protein conserved in bacteria
MINSARRFRTQDSVLSYFINQLDNYDPKLHQPLVAVTWGRDIQLRSGISFANESTSFTRSSFAGGGSLANPATASNGGNMPWISAETSAIQSVSVNGERIVTPLRILGREVSYSSVELERSQLTGQPIDAQKMDALNILYQMNTDQMVYTGSGDVGALGLVNSDQVTSGTVATGALGGTAWTSKTPDEILADVNSLLYATWNASGQAVCPGKLLLPAFQFSYISSQKVSSAGNVSIVKFLKENSIALNVNGKELEIVPVKWLAGRGASSSDRMVAYTNDLNYVRFPMVPIRRETAYYHGIRYTAPYIYGFGEVEFVYPETVRYADGI